MLSLPSTSPRRGAWLEPGEVYRLLYDAAIVTVEGDDIELLPGDVHRIAPESTRQIQNGDTESTFLLAGAP